MLLQGWIVPWTHVTTSNIKHKKLRTQFVQHQLRLELYTIERTRKQILVVIYDLRTQFVQHQFGLEPYTIEHTRKQIHLLIYDLKRKEGRKEGKKANL